MPRRNDRLLDQIALEKKLVTQEQLQEVLKGQPRLLGIALVATGYLTDGQLDERRPQELTPAEGGQR